MVSKARPVGGLLLTHGAGSDRDQSTLVAVEEAMGSLPVRRMNFPYRNVRKGPPDRAPRLVEAVAVEALAFAAERRFRPQRLALGGRSMGGRMCSMAVAEGLPAAALVLIAYPLHPPGKPEKLRTEHLGSIPVPCLFISGTRDPFGTPDELTAATDAIAGEVTHHWIEGGRHDLAGADPEVAATVARWLRAL